MVLLDLCTLEEQLLVGAKDFDCQFFSEFLLFERPEEEWGNFVLI